MQDNEEIRRNPIVVSINANNVGCSTGFFVKENLIATNIHCIAGATSVSAKHLESKTEYFVEGVAAFDANHDLVILKVMGEGTPFSIGDSDLLEKGEIVKAIGSLNGKYVTTKGTFNDTWNNSQWLRTTAKTCDGYSGGPLLNSKGQVIGINFGSGDYYSAAVSSSIMKELLSHIDIVEPLVHWKERDQIKVYAYLVHSKKKNKNKNYDGALDDLDQTIQLKPDFLIAYVNRGTTKSNLAQSKIEEGDLVEAQQLLQDAIKDLTQTIIMCPDYALAYFNRGTAKSRLGQSKFDKSNSFEVKQLLQSAIDDFTIAISLFSDYVIVYNNRADAKLHLAKSEAELGNVEITQDIYQAAETDITTAIELDTTQALFYHTRGEIKSALGNYSAAIDDFKKTSVVDPKYTAASEDLKRAKEALETQNENR